MTHKIPRAPLWLGLAGLIPFVLGALVAAGGFWAHKGALDSPAGYPVLNGADGVDILTSYGTVILCFMSGVLWGFATRAARPVFYVLSVLPALWVFFTTGGHVFAAGSRPDESLIALMWGFAGLLGLDWVFWHYGVTPAWWMNLRVLLTSVVLVCLAIGVYQ